MALKYKSTMGEGKIFDYKVTKNPDGTFKIDVEVKFHASSFETGIKTVDGCNKYFDIYQDYFNAQTKRIVHENNPIEAEKLEAKFERSRKTFEKKMNKLLTDESLDPQVKQAIQDKLAGLDTKAAEYKAAAMKEKNIIDRHSTRTFIKDFASLENPEFAHLANEM